MCIPQSSPMLLTRNLLYTGITRAKKLLIVLSSKNIIDFMIQNVDIKKRNKVMKYLNKDIQVFVTTTDLNDIDEEFLKMSKVFRIKKGNLTRRK